MIILQYLQILNHYVVPLPLIQCCMSILPQLKHWFVTAPNSLYDLFIFQLKKNPFLKTFPNLNYFLKLRFSFYLHIFDPAEIWSTQCKESGSNATIFPILPCSFLPSRLGAGSQESGSTGEPWAEMGFTSSDRSLRKLGPYVWAAAGRRVVVHSGRMEMKATQTKELRATPETV